MQLDYTLMYFVNFVLKFGQNLMSVLGIFLHVVDIHDSMRQPFFNIGYTIILMISIIQRCSTANVTVYFTFAFRISILIRHVIFWQRIYIHNRSFFFRRFMSCTVRHKTSFIFNKAYKKEIKRTLSILRQTIVQFLTKFGVVKTCLNKRKTNITSRAIFILVKKRQQQRGKSIICIIHIRKSCNSYYNALYLEPKVINNLIKHLQQWDKQMVIQKLL